MVSRRFLYLTLANNLIMLGILKVFILISLFAMLITLSNVNTATAQNIWGDVIPCVSGEYRPCGIDTGECKRGVRTCEDGYWSDCTNNIVPVEEICSNEKDEDCNGVVDDCVDNTFGYICMGAGVIILIIALILQKTKFAEKKEKVW